MLFRSARYCIKFLPAIAAIGAFSIEMTAAAGPVETAAPDTGWKLMMRGTAEHDAAHYQKGLALLDKAVAASPKDPQCYIQRGRCYCRLEQFDKAVADYDRALALHPSAKMTSQTLKFKITALKFAKKWREVLTECDRLGKLNPYDFFVYTSRATAYEKLGQREQSQKAGRIAFNLAPRGPAYYQAASAIKSEGEGQERFKAALNFFNAHLKAHPFDGPAYYQRAGINSQLGRDKEALADYQQAVKYDPDTFLTNADRARYLYSQKLYKEAVAGFTDALEVGPGNDHLLFERAACYNKLGQYDLAIKDYTALSSLHPDEEDPLHYRARAYVLSKQYGKALMDYDKVIYLAPDQASNFRERGELYEKMGKHDLALKDAAKATALLNGK